MIKKNITSKLTFGFISIVLISTLFIGIISIYIFKGSIYKVKENNIKKHALEIATTIKPYLKEDSSKEEFAKIINLIDDIDNSKVWIINSQASIITVSDDNNGIKYSNDEDMKNLYKDTYTKALDGLETYYEGYNPYYGEEMITVGVPIKDDNKVIGAVVVNSSIADLANSVDKFFVSLVLAVLGEVVIVGLLGYYFSRGISRPIKKINSAAIDLARGQYGIETNIFQKDEIGELSSSFDLLSLKLKYTVGELFEERNKLSNIISSISEGIIALDENFKIININKAAKSLLLEESALYELSIIEEFESAIKYDTKKSLTKEYQSKVLHFSISPIKNNSDKIIGGVILIQDISEKEKLEQMRKDFISNVSHEFRTPLAVIKGNLESIIDGMTKPEDVLETCLILSKETDRLERMVRDLLNLSKLDAGKVELCLDELDLNMLVNDTARSLKTLMRNKEIDLQLHLENSIRTMLSDYDKLKQLLIIFIDNAIKFSDKKGIIEISTYSDTKKIYIKIKDNGIGIPKNEIEYLGEKFFKADKSRNNRVEGNGLGLSIAKKLVNILNGSFYINSDFGKGTEITISFLIFQNRNEVK